MNRPLILDYLARKFNKLEKEECIALLTKLGWDLIGSGSFKVAYGKQGVNFVIKFCRYENTRNSVPIHLEMGNYKKFGAMIACGEGSKGVKWGIQERAEWVLDKYNDRKIHYYINKINKCRDEYNSDPDTHCDCRDNHGGNWGVLKNGKVVKID